MSAIKTKNQQEFTISTDMGNGYAKKLRPSAWPTISFNQELTIDNVVAIVFRNAGTATVNIWGGMYTLDSKETLSLNVTESGGVMDIEGMGITFDTTTGGVKALQIVTIRKQNC